MVALPGAAPGTAIGVLGSATEPIRASARHSWEVLVEGADDAPSSAALQVQLADALYAADLLVVLVWTQDRSPERLATKEAIAATVQTLATLRPLLETPFGAAALAQVAGIAGRLGIGRESG